MANPRKPKAKPQSVVPTTKAPEVEALAADLIERQHHGLRGAVIKYGFTTKKSKRFGRVVLVREEVQTLTERKVCFLVIVSKLYWDAYEREPIRREAALDELLCSMSYDGMTPRVEKPDCKGYRANILRYGLQTDELAMAFKGCQLVLPAMADIERELAEPTPPPRCDDCGEPVDGDRHQNDGLPICEACWKFRIDNADPENSNADDEGAHCEGCGSWGREDRLVEQPDARLLCWRCREAVHADGSDDEAPGDPTTLDFEGGVAIDPEQFAEFAGGVDVDGVEFTEHAAATGGAA